ncbi:M42 family metallopeptidase [candidate division KSB1 bacterium]
MQNTPLRISKIIIVCFLFSVTSLVCSYQADSGEELSVLRDLITVAGVSMHEEPVVEKIKELLPDNVEYQTDDMNNLLVTLGDGEPEILFIAHSDEIGLEVTGINEDGTLSTRGRGGSYSTVWESKVVKIHTKNGVIDGIIPPRSSYMSRTPEGHSRNDLIVDIGTQSITETEALGIEAGDFIVQEKRMTPLANGRYTAGSIDDRAGCAAQLIALRRLAGKNLNKTVVFAWCVEEETGLTGSGYIARTLAPKYVFPVDTFVSSDAPRDETNIGYAPLGNGAVLRVFDSSNITPRDAFLKVRDLAQSRNIPVQWGITSGGNDGSRFLSAGSIDFPLSWPGIYSHSYVSVIDMRDFNALVDLIVAIAESL